MNRFSKSQYRRYLFLAVLLMPVVASADPSFSAAEVSYITTNNTLRSVEHRMQEMLNVMDFGAMGRCQVSDPQSIQYTQNDTAAFNAAVKAASESGKILYIPHGDYCVESIDARNLDRLHIVGASHVLRTRLIGGKNGLPILDVSGTNDLIIESIKINPTALVDIGSISKAATPSCAILLGRTNKGGEGAILRDLAIWGGRYGTAGICSLGRAADYYERVSINFGPYDLGVPRILLVANPPFPFFNDSELVGGPNAGIVMLAPALAATQAGTPLITIVDGQDISIVGAEFLAPPAAENGKAQIETTNVKNLVLYGGYNERLPGARPVDYLSVNGQSEGILLEGLRAYRPVVQQGASVDHFTVLSTFLADTTIVRGQVTNSWLDLGGMGLKTTESASITGSIISGIALQQEVPAIASGNHIVRAHTPVLDDVESALSLTQKTDKTLGRPQRVLGNLQRTSKIFNQSASIAPTVDWALAKPTNAAIELTLPSAASVSGQSKTIKKMAGSTQNLVVKAATGETIDALADATISSPSGSLELTSDGENWWITNGS